MVKKAYDSEEYLAQGLRDYFSKANRIHIPESVKNAKHSQNSVLFKYDEADIRAEFNYVNGKLILFVGMSTVGDEEKRERILEKKLKIRRSKSGRVSPRFYENLAQYAICDPVFEFLRCNLNSK